MCFCSSTFDHSCCNPSIFLAGLGVIHVLRLQSFRREGQTLGSAVEQGSDTWRLFVPWAPGIPKCWVLAWVWWKTSCTTWDVQNFVNNGIFAISTDARFLPSTMGVLQNMFKFDWTMVISNGRSADLATTTGRCLWENARHMCSTTISHNALHRPRIGRCLGETFWSWGWSYFHILPYQEASKPGVDGSLDYTAVGGDSWPQLKKLRRCVGSRPQFRSLTSFLCFRHLKLSNSHHHPPWFWS